MFISLGNNYYYFDTFCDCLTFSRQSSYTDECWIWRNTWENFKHFSEVLKNYLQSNEILSLHCNTRSWSWRKCSSPGKNVSLSLKRFHLYEETHRVKLFGRKCNLGRLGKERSSLTRGDGISHRDRDPRHDNCSPSRRRACYEPRLMCFPQDTYHGIIIPNKDPRLESEGDG